MKIITTIGLFGVTAGMAHSLCYGSGDKNHAPNIIIILADDMGYSDVGCFGGEINTPNIDYLAANGLRFTRFYNAGRSCPTRASLLTGLYPHQAGLAQNGRNLSTNAVTIAEVLKSKGYHTGMAGKWHLSETIARRNYDEQLMWLSHRADYGDFAPIETYPHRRGFDEFWGVVWGVVNYYHPFSLVHNGEPIKEVDDDFYITDFITEKSIEIIENFSKDNKPFFLYVSYTSPHWPLHALQEDINKYIGKYNDGWDSLRVRRYRKMIQLGLFDKKSTPLARNESGLLWENCKRKEWEAAHMEAHSAMVDRMDQGIGRIIKILKEKNILNNTLIFFLSDNGASPERGFKPGFDRPGHTRDGDSIVYFTFERPGPEKTWGYLGRAWAGAINAPFRFWKAQSYEGGICTPLIVHWPDGLKTKPGTITDQAGHVMDIMATCLDISGANYPEIFNGNKIVPIEGKSLLPVFKNKKRKGHEWIAFEHEGGRALLKGEWKISALRGSDWELFNLSSDRTETKNVRDIFPQKASELIEIWNKWAEKMKMFN